MEPLSDRADAPVIGWQVSSCGSRSDFVAMGALLCNSDHEHNRHAEEKLYRPRVSILGANR